MTAIDFIRADRFLIKTLSKNSGGACILSAGTQNAVHL